MVIFGKKLEALRQALAVTADRLGAELEEQRRRHDERLEALRSDIEHIRTDVQELRRLVHGALIDPESEHAQIRGVGALLRNETDEMPETEEWKQAREEQRLFVAAWNQLYGSTEPLFESDPDKETQD